MDSLVQLGKFFGWVTPPGILIQTARELGVEYLQFVPDVELFSEKQNITRPDPRKYNNCWCRCSGDVGSTLARLAQNLEC